MVGGEEGRGKCFCSFITGHRSHLIVHKERRDEREKKNTSLRQNYLSAFLFLLRKA